MDKELILCLIFILLVAAFFGCLLITVNNKEVANDDKEA